MSKRNKNPYKRCKYLDDLNIPITDYGTNFCNQNTDNRARKWRRQRTKYGFDERETWSIDELFVEWIYTRFKMFKEISCVDLTFYKFHYIDKEITQEEAIDIILASCEDYLKTSFTERKFLSDEVCTLIFKVMPAMWW